MSGINEIKKKAKMSIDEMYDSQSVGLMDVQKDGNQETNKDIKTETQQNDNPLFHVTNNSSDHKTEHPFTQTPMQSEFRKEVDQELKSQSFAPTFPIKQQTSKVPTHKMTFNLTEEIFKGFNDIYAHRLLQGRKTEKSELICEAIQWLIKMEQQAK